MDGHGHGHGHGHGQTHTHKHTYTFHFHTKDWKRMHMKNTRWHFKETNKDVESTELDESSSRQKINHQNFYKDINQTHWKVSEDLESGTQKVDEVHQVSGGTAIGLSHVPFIVCQLDEFINFLVKLGVNLPLCSMTSVLKKKKKN